MEASYLLVALTNLIKMAITRNPRLPSLLFTNFKEMHKHLQAQYKGFEAQNV